MTMGMVRVACWTARTAVVGPATITSTLRRTELGRKLRKAHGVPVRITRLEEKVLPLDIAQRAESLAKCLALHSVGGRRRGERDIRPEPP
jgi:hypothetical protein